MKLNKESIKKRAMAKFTSWKYMQRKLYSEYEIANKSMDILLDLIDDDNTLAVLREVMTFRRTGTGHISMKKVNDWIKKIEKEN